MKGIGNWRMDKWEGGSMREGGREGRELEEGVCASE